MHLSQTTDSFPIPHPWTLWCDTQTPLQEWGKHPPSALPKEMPSAVSPQLEKLLHPRSGLPCGQHWRMTASPAAPLPEGLSEVSAKTTAKLGLSLLPTPNASSPTGVHRSTPEANSAHSFSFFSLSPGQLKLKQQRYYNRIHFLREKSLRQDKACVQSHTPNEKCG